MLRFSQITRNSKKFSLRCNKFVYIFDENEKLKEHIVSMYFNVPEDIAIQHLLLPSINTDVLTKNVSDLHELENRHKDIFWRVLDTIDIDNYDAFYFLDFVYCLAKSNIMVSENYIQKRESIKKKIIGYSKHITNIRDFNNFRAEGLVYLFSINQDKEYISKLISTIQFPVFDYSTEDLSKILAALPEIEQGYKSFINNLDIIYKQISDMRLNFDNLFNVNLNEYELIELAAQINEEHHDLLNWFPVSKISKEKLTKAINDLINQGIYQDRHLHAMKIFIKEKIAFDYKIIDSLTERLSKENFNYVGEMLETLWLLRSKSDMPNIRDYVDNKLDTITTQKAHVLHHLYDCTRDDYKDSYGAAWCLFIYIYKVTDVRSPSREQNVGHSENGYKMVRPLFNEKLNDIFDKFYKIIEKYEAMEVLYKIAEMNEDTFSLSSEVLKRIISEHPDNLLDFFPCDQISKYWVSLYLLIGSAEFERLVKNIITQDSKELFALEKNLPNRSKNYRGWLRHKVNQIPAEKWKEIKNRLKNIGYPKLYLLKTEINNTSKRRQKQEPI